MHILNHRFSGQPLRHRQPRRERGMTALGMLILVGFVGLFVFAGIKLIPAYLENMKIASTFEKLDDEFSGQGASREQIRRSIEKRFDVEVVNVINYRDVEIKKTTEGYTVTANYTHIVPFIANVSFAVAFQNEVTVRR
jgi:hypothetical protein